MHRLIVLTALWTLIASMILLMLDYRPLAIIITREVEEVFDKPIKPKKPKSNKSK